MDLLASVGLGQKSRIANPQFGDWQKDDFCIQATSPPSCLALKSSP
jgi:hypothetical protein